MIEAIVRLVNRLRGGKTMMDEKTDEPLYGDIKTRCERCGGRLICVNDRTHQMACANSMCRR